ncbi:efflux RND transporter permease subunit [Sphingoaurantiacus capsulatus]|uniref:Efflux RND transporter permease subunit n=1 Tax=Sphingoaurantiacus capsulatus TaxID=1771310 RepID=A0ABV7XB11_9SPHN
MNGLIEFAVRRWQITLVVFAMLAAMGLSALLSIPRSVDPHFPIPVVAIIAVQPGADPADMEQTVAKPIEDVLRGIDNIDEISSRSTDGSSVITAEFDWGGDTEKYYDEVVREVNAIRGTLPSSLQRLEFRKVRTTESAVLQLALVSDTASVRRLEKIAEDLRDRITQVDGIRRSQVFGIAKPEIRVSIDSGRLAQIGLPVTTVTDALRAGGSDLPAGAVHSAGQRLNVEAGGAFRSLAEVKETPVRAADGRVVRVGDIADVAWSTEEVTHVTRFNGQRAIFVTALQKDNINVLDVRDGVMEAVEEFRGQLPPDVKLEVGFDQSRDISSKLRILARDFTIALALVLITLLPLGTRASIVVMVSIPLSLAMGVMAMQLLGFTLNQLAITGFIVALGLLVDDSIVVAENISRHLRMGKPRLQAALDGTKQIAVAVLGCTATLLLAFLPLVFLPEGAGMFTRSLPLAVLVTVAASMVVSLTIVPFLASRMLPRDEDPHGNRILQAVQGGIHRFYGPVLHWSLTHPRRALLAAMALCFSAFALVPVIGTSLFPPADATYFLVEVEGGEGASIEKTDQAIRYVDSVLAKEPLITSRMANTGRGNPQVFYNVREETQATNAGNVLAVMDHWDTDESPALLARLRATFDAYPDARILVREFLNGPPIDAPIVVFVNGPELDELKRLAGEVEGILRETPGTRNIENPLSVDRIDLNLGLDDEKAALLGVQAGSVRRAARLALAGEPAGRFRDSEGDAYDVVVRLPMDGFQRVSALESIYIPSSSGGAIPLRQIATPRLESAPAQINRYQQQRSVNISSYIDKGYLTSAVSKDVYAKLDSLKLPPGYTITQGGEAEASSRSFQGMGRIVLLAIFGILAVLVLEFGRFRETAVVAGVIPLGMFGGLLALLLTGNSLSYNAVIGFVALIGIEIKNSILLVDFTTQLRQQGVELRDAIEQAGEVRFLPVLLTSITAIGGLMPLALSGSGLYSPLAWVIIGGLVSSTLLSRVVTPVMYLLLVRHAPALDPGVSPEMNGRASD